MADMIVALEKNPFKPRLTKNNPFRGFLECQVRYSPRETESWLKEALIHGEDEATIGSKLANGRGEEVRFSLQTSLAVDIIKAGEKTNQLPENISAVVNYRIAPHDSVASVKKAITDVLTPIAKKHGIFVQGFDSTKSAPKGAPVLHLTSKGDTRPSPISPTGPDSKIWSVFSGTLRQVFEDVPTLKGRTVVLAGNIMIGKLLLPVVF
jgi:Gly-Xaa carboxypeptidase